MRRVLFILKGLILLFAIVSDSLAAPHNAEPFQLLQPDGSFVNVLVWGDEFYQHVESFDGYTLIRDPETNWICYATSRPDGNLISSGVVYGNTSNLKSLKNFEKNQKNTSQFIRSEAESRKKELGYYKMFQSDTLRLKSKSESVDGVLRHTLGFIKGVTILIDFSDSEATIPVLEINNMINQKGYSNYGNNGSVHDYFFDTSNGKMSFTSDVLGYYRAPKPKSYYDNPELNGYEKVDELLRAILDSVDADYSFNLLSQFGSYLISVNFMYAGNPLSGWGKGLWPHSGFLGKTVDGVSIGTYQISRLSNELSIGTFCHESGHSILKLPDLYDYDNDSRGIGLYGLMASINHKNPQPINAFFRDLCSWETVEDITSLQTKQRFSLPSNQNYSLLHKHPFLKNEFFYIESRLQKGRSAAIPDEGLLVWHIDFLGNNSFQERTWKKHYYVSVIQADNAFDLELNRNSGFKGDLFHAGGNNQFSNATLPAANWWDGSPSHLSISDIGSIGDTMHLIVHPVAGDALKPIYLDKPLKNGLSYKLLKGNFRIMPDFSDFDPLNEGVAKNISVRFNDLYEGFALEFTGFIKIPYEGSYLFRLNSDDGSILYINNRAVINNTADLNGVSEDVNLYLEEGFYEFKTEYFQYKYNFGIDLIWETPLSGLARVPDSVFYIVEEPLGINAGLVNVPEINYNSLLQELRVTHYKNNAYRYEIFALNGLPVKTGESTYNNAVHIQLTPGVYIVKIISEKSLSFTKKIVVFRN